MTALDATRDILSAASLAPAGRPEILHRLAVVIGVGRGPGRPLENAPRDALSIAEVLEKGYGFQVEKLLDGNATHRAVARAVLHHLRGADAATQWVFYFAGHGTVEDGEGYLLPVDASDRDRRGWLSVSWLLERCQESACGEILVLLDACKAGQALVRGEDLDGPLSPDPAAWQRVRQILCAGNPDQSARDGGGEGHSIFTERLLEALEGRAGIHDGTGRVRFSALRDWTVSEVGRRLPEGLPQTPIGGNFRSNAEQKDFILQARVPLLPPETVKAVQSSEAARRQEGLARLAEDVRRDPGLLAPGVKLARAHTFPEEAEDAAVRIQAVKTLYRMAGLRRAGMEALLAEPLLKSALEDPSAAVRGWARSGLCRMGPAARGEAAVRILEQHRRGRGGVRRRAWEAAAWLPKARRELPWRVRWRTPVARSRLGCAFLGREMVATRARKRALKGVALTVALLYAGLASTYYFSVQAPSTVVVRLGHPGFKILPGVGWLRVATDFDLGDLRDATPVREERLWGTWLPLEGGVWPWGKQLFDQLTPAAAGLAEWRMGGQDRAFAHFQEGVDAGDGEVVPLLGYVALQSPEAVRPAIELLVRTLAGDERLHDAALDALAVVRDTQPVASAEALADLAERLSGSSGAEAVALVESVEILEGTRKDSSVQDALLALLRRHRQDPALRQRIARTLKDLVARRPARLAGVLSEVRSAILQGPRSERAQWLAVIDPPESLPVEVERQVLEILTAALATAGDPAEEVGWVEVLGRRLSHSPALAAPHVPVLLSLLKPGQDPRLRLAAAGALGDLPAGTAPGVKVVRALEDLVRSSEPLELRIEAVEILSGLRHPGLRDHVLSALLTAVSQGNSLVRDAAVARLVEYALGCPEPGRAVAALHGLLRDPSPSIRQQAALGVLLLGTGNGEEEALALREVVSGLGSDDPTEARNISNSLVEMLPASPAGTRRRVLLDLAAYAGTLNVFTVDPFLKLIERLSDEQPGLLAESVLALTLLLASPDPEGDVPALARNRLFRLQGRPQGQLVPVIAQLGERLSRPSGPERATAAEALGILAAGHEELASGAVAVLVPLLSDPEVAVRTAAAGALGTVGSARPYPARRGIPPLLVGLGQGPAALRLACAQALGRVQAEPELAGKTVQSLLATSRDSSPELRRQAARAFRHWALGAPHEMADALTPLRRWLAGEPDPRAREELASAVAVLGGGNPGIAGEMLGLAGRWAVSPDQGRREAAVWLLRNLATQHPRTSVEAIEALRPFLDGEDLRRPALVTLFEIGTADPQSAMRVVDLVGPLLLQRRPGRWDMIANCLRPVVREQPTVAAQVVHWLQDLLESDLLATEGPPLAPVAAEALLDATVALARSDPDAAWPLLTAGSPFARSVGQAALARLAAEQPDRVPVLLARLSACRRSLQPHVRLSVAQAAEMIGLLQKTASLLEKPGAGRWREILEGLPRKAVGEAVPLALDKLKPGVRHG